MTCRLQTLSNNKRVIIYLLPVTFLSFLFNIPKFMDVTTTEEDGTSQVEATESRKDPTYNFWYIISLIWHPTLTIGILPFLLLSVMNLMIFLRIRNTRMVRSVDL